jgi:hypothetical protein
MVLQFYISVVCALSDALSVIYTGGLHNIIRGVPLVRYNERGQVEWYQRGSGQIGMEGFVVGGMYVAFALCCTSLLSAPKLFSDPGVVRTVSYVSLAGALYMFSAVVRFYSWKTGYNWRFYLREWLKL